MRKGFIIDLQSGLNYNGDYIFEEIDGPKYLFPGSGSDAGWGGYLYPRKTRIGDMWRVTGSADPERLILSSSLETIDVSIGDYLIVKATGSDGYVCRFSSSHWDIHKVNPDAGDGISYSPALNEYSVDTKDYYGIVADSDGISLSGSNLPAAKTDIKDDDAMLFLSGSNESPQTITYAHFKADLTPSLTDKFADGYLILDHKMTSDDIQAFTDTNPSYGITTWGFGSDVALAQNTNFHAHIGNLFLKVSSSHNELDAADYEIEHLSDAGTTLRFKLQNLKFKVEVDDILQVFCFVSGSTTITSVSGPGA